MAAAGGGRRGRCTGLRSCDRGASPAAAGPHRRLGPPASATEKMRSCGFATGLWGFVTAAGADRWWAHRSGTATLKTGWRFPEKTNAQPAPDPESALPGLAEWKRVHEAFAAPLPPNTPGRRPWGHEGGTHSAGRPRRQDGCGWAPGSAEPRVCGKPVPRTAFSQGQGHSDGAQAGGFQGREAARPGKDGGPRADRDSRVSTVPTDIETPEGTRAVPMLALGQRHGVLRSPAASCDKLHVTLQRSQSRDLDKDGATGVQGRPVRARGPCTGCALASGERPHLAPAARWGGSDRAGAHLSSSCTCDCVCRRNSHSSCH